MILLIVEKLLSKYKWKKNEDTFEYQKLLLLTYPEKKRRACKECKKHNKRTDTYFY